MIQLFKKKKAFRATCEISNMQLDKESAYLLTAAEVVTSRKFWDKKMTEPDTMMYTEAHFKSGDTTALQIRRMIFEKYAREKDWLVSDAEIHLFDVDRGKAKSRANTWWDHKGELSTEESANSLARLGNRLDECRQYAVLEAGKKFVPA